MFNMKLESSHWCLAVVSIQSSYKMYSNSVPNLPTSNLTMIKLSYSYNIIIYNDSLKRFAARLVGDSDVGDDW